MDGAIEKAHYPRPLSSLLRRAHALIALILLRQLPVITATGLVSQDVVIVRQLGKHLLADVGLLPQVAGSPGISILVRCFLTRSIHSMPYSAY